jgi:hypothetical protein
MQKPPPLLSLKLVSVSLQRKRRWGTSTEQSVNTNVAAPYDANGPYFVVRSPETTALFGFAPSSFRGLVVKRQSDFPLVSTEERSLRKRSISPSPLPAGLRLHLLRSAESAAQRRALRNEPQPSELWDIIWSRWHTFRLLVLDRTRQRFAVFFSFRHRPRTAILPSFAANGQQNHNVKEA